MRIAIVLCLLSGLLVSCGDSHESVSQDMVDKMEEMAEVLEGVGNDAQAREAVEKIQSLGKDFEELGQRMKDLGEAEGDVAKELEEKYGKKMKEIGSRMAASGAKLLEYPELMKAWQDAVKHLDVK